MIARSALRCLLLCALFPLRAARDSPRQCGKPSTQKEMNSFLWTVKRPSPQPPLLPVRNHPHPLTISKLTSCQLLPNGESLQSLLPRDLYRRLKRHLEYVKHMMPFWMTADQRGRGLYADYLFNAIAGNWERKRPVWVMLMVNSLTESDIPDAGNARTGPVPRAGGRAAGEADWSCGERGGAVPPPQWTQLLPVSVFLGESGGQSGCGLRIFSRK
ncbi:hypothetical protein MHYP_G00327790 [Metynnis hypsauchen]